MFFLKIKYDLQLFITVKCLIIMRGVCFQVWFSHEPKKVQDREERDIIYTTTIFVSRNESKPRPRYCTTLLFQGPLLSCRLS